MKSNKYLIFLIAVFCILLTTKAVALPDGFVYLKDVNPTIIQDIRYYTDNNFVGRPIDGYKKPTCILTKEAALKLSNLQRRLQAQSLGLKVYDCYRPQRAVNEFIAWSKVSSDQKMKEEYYPHVNKADFFKLDYVAAKSGHTRGSTVDLTIVRYDDNGVPIELDMATHFDYLDKMSHPLAHGISEKAKRHQLFLRNVMHQAGFKPIETEWWHFTLIDEPFPTKYFNFEVV